MTFFPRRGGLIKNEREPFLGGAEWRVHGTLKFLIKKLHGKLLENGPLY